VATHQGKAAVRKSQFATRRNKTNSKNRGKTLRAASLRRKRRGKQFLRFPEVEGKTVEFIELGTAADFPCVEIGFADRTALHVVMDTRLTMEPVYSDWKTGNQRRLRQWPVVECR
jgi:hypothetical protein